MATSAVNIKPASDMTNSLMELSSDANSAARGNMSDARTGVRFSKDASELIAMASKIGMIHIARVIQVRTAMFKLEGFTVICCVAVAIDRVCNVRVIFDRVTVSLELFVSSKT